MNRGISRHRSPLLAIAATLAVAASILVGSPAAAHTSAGQTSAASVTATAPSVSAVRWTACRDGFQCTTVQVPLDYGDRSGPQISLSLIRLPAGSPSRRIGSLFLNPGGPGGSGVDFARGVAKFLPLEVRARFDIVGFDPRGIARSTPLRCYDTLDQAFADLPPFPYPVTAAEEEVQRAADQKLASACAARGGPILAHMSTADAARDLDYLRRALGDGRLNYLGYSYGSVLGQTYANLFPGTVRALVIDAVVDPVAWTTGRGGQASRQPFSYRIRSDVGAEQTLGEFFRLCDAAGPDCAFAGDGAARYEALVKRLRAEPVEFIDPVTGETFIVTEQVLIAVTLGALYQPFVWPDAAALLAELEGQADPDTLGRTFVAIRDGIGADRVAQEPYPNFVEGSPGVACSDSINPDRFSAWPAAADAAEQRSPNFGRIWTWTWSVCHPWPDPPAAGQDRYMGPWTARTSKPVLIVGNYFDPATRYQGAVTASRLLPNSRLLSYAGWGHGVSFLGGNFCIDSAVVQYLVTTRPPANGTVCEPEGSPFGPLQAAELTAARAAAAAVGPSLPEPVRRAFGG